MTIVCVQNLCSFGAMLFNVNMLIKTDSTVICVPCMLEHVCYEPLSLKTCRFRRYLMLTLPVRKYLLPIPSTKGGVEPILP